jgi:chromosomal replication initiation ATPase DnaA
MKCPHCEAEFRLVLVEPKPVGQDIQRDLAWLAEALGTTPEHLRSAKTLSWVAKRGVACAVLRNLNYGVTKIARALGKHHTSVIYAAQTARNLRPVFIENLTLRLKIIKNEPT